MLRRYPPSCCRRPARPCARPSSSCCAAPGPLPRASRSSARLAGGAEVCVAGDGPAIPPDQVARLFEPFAGPSGHGLDLFLARELAEGWGGAVRVEPSGSAGTVFVVTCPLTDAGDRRQGTRD